jgi:hypothetical protein
MKKHILTTTFFAVAALAPLHAKVYTFADFSADFKKQPEVQKGATHDNIPYTSYMMEFSDGAFVFAAYTMTIDVPVNMEFQYGKACGNANSPVERTIGDVNGYPSIAFRYTTSSGDLMFEAYVYATDRVFKSMVITTHSNSDSAFRLLTSFLKSMKINAPPPTATTGAPPIRRGVPVTNGDSIGEI